MIRIRSKIPGFRRAGFAHPGEWVEHANDAFTPEQLLSILTEPNLQVELPGMDIDEVKHRLEGDIALRSAIRNVGAPPTKIEAVPENKADAQALKELQDMVQRQSDRIIELEKQLAEAAEEALLVADEKTSLEAEIERMKALLPKSGQEAAPEEKPAEKGKK